MDAHLVLQADVRGSEVFPRVGAAVRSSYEVLYHQADVDERKTVTYGKRSLHTGTANTHMLYASVSVPTVYMNAAVSVVSPVSHLLRGGGGNGPSAPAAAERHLYYNYSERTSKQKINKSTF